MRVEFEAESDGRIIACAPDLPGVLVYGRDHREALLKVLDLADKVRASMREYEDRRSNAGGE